MAALQGQNNLSGAFGDFRIDFALRTLFHKGHPRKLTPKSFDLLLVLYAHRGRNQTYKELYDHVWKGQNADPRHLVQQTMRPVLAAVGRAWITTLGSYGYLFAADERSLPTDNTTDDIILEQRLPTKLLEQYYPDADLKAQKLMRYSLSVNGKQVKTNIATSQSWLGLNLRVNEEAHARFPLRGPQVTFPHV